MATTNRRWSDQRSTDPGAAGWDGLESLIWARLLVVALALPIGVLMQPVPPLWAWRLLGLTLAVYALLSGIYWLGLVWRRAFRVQVYAQLGFDVVLVTALAALTGGPESPFALFYVLIVITGGLHAGLLGGLVTAVAASAAFLALNPSGPGLVSLAAELPKPGMFSALLVVLGVLSAALGRRVQRARENLERAARELDRVRFDNDVILLHLTSGVITLDGSGTVAYLNPAAEDVLGIQLSEVRGRWVQNALPPRLQALRDALLAVLESHATRTRGELLLQNAAGHPLPLGISTNVLRHDGVVTGVVGVFQDLTEVREMEQRALRNQTLAEVGALAAGIAHELRNGLSPISGSVEILQRELKLDGEHDQLMELIGTECTRLNRFVTDLLAYSRERPLVKQTLDLNENLADLCEHLARDPRRGRQVTVRFEPGEGLVELQADPEQLRQVWLNLAVNALDALGESGTLTVRWRMTDGEHAAIEFADTGRGITAEERARVGQLFFTTKKGGTGLGLPIALRIVERHGGSLNLLAAPGGGTIARVTLPARAGEAAHVA